MLMVQLSSGRQDGKFKDLSEIVVLNDNKRQALNIDH